MIKYILFTLLALGSIRSEETFPKPELIPDKNQTFISYDESLSRSTNDCGCGQSIYGLSSCGVGSSRIVRGRNARQNEYPWQVLLTLRGSDTFSCGGTIINKKYILTAQHCFPSRTFQVTVQVGLHRKGSVTPYTKTYQTNIFKFLSGYNSATLANDVALVKINGGIQFNRGVRPACLPSNNANLFVGRTAIASGWGSLNALGGASPLVLQSTAVTIVSRAQPNLYLFTFRRNTGICSGDSGGPLVLEDGRRCTLVGITSFVRDNCATNRYADGFMRVSHYLPWITANSQDGACNGGGQPIVKKCNLSCWSNYNGNYLHNGQRVRCVNGVCWYLNPRLNLCQVLGNPCNRG